MSSRASTKLIANLGSTWWGVGICSLLVLLAGSRLVMLSMRLHATQARASAQLFADRAAQAMQSQLQALEVLAQQRAALAANTPATTDTRTRLTSLAPSRDGFWLLADGSALGVTGAEREASSIIIAETSLLASSGATQIVGPVRQGGRWLVAARAPLAMTAPVTSAPIGWALVYRDLDTLLVGARLDRATRAGYDFELSRLDPGSGRLLALTGSAAGGLSSPVASAVGLPGNGPANSWRFAVRPRAGWYPADELVVDVSLLLLVTWLTALGLRDVTRHLTHLRTALAVSRRRLHSAQQRLTQEIELHQGLQKSFEHAHFHDAFTGLPNRHLFLDKLERALREMRTRPGYSIAVLLIAIDRFKVITDTLGHTAGDELMVQITRLFDQALGSREHVLARWADDELALMLVDAQDPQLVLETAKSLQERLQEPIEMRRHRILVATGIGVTHVETGLQRTEEVLREADVALSSAKTPGGASVVIYSTAMQDQLMQSVSLEGDLHTALQREEFRLLFQPIVDLRSRQIVGVEVLLRWLHPLEGLLTPDRFLSFAEEAGLIVPITRWIVVRACELSGQWRQRLPPGRDFYLSINLSPAVLLDPGLCEFVEQMLIETDTDPASLKFELTENGLISNVGAARHVLDQLHELGIELMLDDFGTGYSSLSHLQLFPFDYIKLDAPVDNRLSPDPSNGALVRAMAQMASTLGLKTIAEIVETTAAVERLQQIGCEFAQGYAFCRPVDAEQAFKRLIANVIEPRDEFEEQPDSPTLILPALPEHAVS